MKYLASYLLLVAGGKTTPTAADVKALMASVGVEAEEERLTSLISALEGKNVDEVKNSFQFLVAKSIVLLKSCIFF
jgi:large subunit ribosomal protein LP2